MKIKLLFAIFLMANVASQAQNIKIVGSVQNAKDSIITFQKANKSILTGIIDRTPYIAKIKNGSFEISLPVTNIEAWNLACGNFNWLVQLIPKENLTLSIDMNMDMRTGFTKGIVAGGKNAGNFNLVFQFLSEPNKEQVNLYEKLKTTNNVVDALILRKENNELYLRSLDKYKTTITKEYYKWWLTDLAYIPYERAFIEDIMFKKLKVDDQTFKILLEKGINDDYAAENSQTYSDYVRTYVDYQLFNNSSNGTVLVDETINYVIKNLKGLTRSSYLTKQMVNYNNLDDSTYQRLYKKYTNVVKDKRLITLVENARSEYLSGVSGEVDVKRFPLLANILKKYLGKVVYIDFWASWCLPCREEILNSNILKTKLMSKNVVFLYLGYNEQQENWLIARKELGIEGEHIILGPKLIQEANELFQISGIPHYAIIDKDGKLLNKHAPRPSDVYDELLKLADEK